MKILFVHQNFPGQFKALAPALADAGHEVSALHMRKTDDREWNGVKLFRYKPGKGSTKGVHLWAMDFETKIIRAEACFRAALVLRDQDYHPDVIVAHHGWGESLFLKDVWPEARMGIFCEFYYSPHGSDVGFDPEFPVKDPEGDACRLRLKNLNNLMHFEIAEAGISPTQWQASTFPEQFRSKITVVHDGIDTAVLKPKPEVRMKFNLRDGRVLDLSRQDEIITFVNRNLEPYRGYHIFMRALPELLRRRPDARVLIVGGNEVSYGPPPDEKKYGKKNWQQIYVDEVKPRIAEKDWQRIHFLGKIPYHYFIPLLQLSTVHVYLTYPFVLSWSLLEAMSVGCAIVASDTQPLHEAIRHNDTGRLVNFFDVDSLTDQVCQLLNEPKTRERLGTRARKFAREHYDLKTVCLPRQMAWVESLAEA